MSSRKGLPQARKMRHDRHFVEELTNSSVVGVGFMLPVDSIETSREQPRSTLGDLSELAASIGRHGVLEPLLVRKVPDEAQKYQLIAGERRFHAALEAGLREVPCIEMTATDQEALEVALIENLQRKDLTPFEEGEGYRTLVEKYGYTHEQVASAVGKARTTVSEALRLLTVPPAIRDLCRHADITAKSMLLLIARAGSIEEMELMVQEIAERSLDREAARAAALALREGEEASPTNGVTGATGEGQDDDRFKPLQIRYRPAPDAPVRLSLSIRQPGITRDDVIRTLQELIHRLRRGELDEQLAPGRVPSKP